MQLPVLPLSYLTFRIDVTRKAPITVSHPPPFSLNNARIVLESRCLVHDREQGSTTEYVLGASCKTERVGVEKDIWLDPNGDYCPLLSRDEYLDLKHWAQIGIGPDYDLAERGQQQERTFARVEDAFDSVRIDMQMAEAEEITGAAEIVRATLANDILAGRIEFTAEDRYEITIDFPIKTMNANERDDVYQTDTGPVLLPDFSGEYEHFIERFRRAYVAVNCPDWAEFIVQTPTPLTDDIAVNHYSEPVRLDTTNSIYRLSL